MNFILGSIHKDNYITVTSWVDFNNPPIIIKLINLLIMTTKTDPNQNYTINEFYIKVKGDYGKEKNVRVNDMGDKLLTLITDLGWEYQRMSMSGKEVFDEIHQLLGTIPEGEVYMEI